MKLIAWRGGGGSERLKCAEFCIPYHYFLQKTSDGKISVLPDRYSKRRKYIPFTRRHWALVHNKPPKTAILVGIGTFSFPRGPGTSWGLVIACLRTLLDGVVLVFWEGGRGGSVFNGEQTVRWCWGWNHIFHSISVTLIDQDHVQYDDIYFCLNSSGIFRTKIMNEIRWIVIYDTVGLAAWSSIVKALTNIHLTYIM